MGKTKLEKPKIIKVGHLEGQYWIWPDGSKTHLRFIKEAVMKYRPLPKGIYAEAKKLNLPNLNTLMAKAKSLGLKDTMER